MPSCAAPSASVEGLSPITTVPAASAPSRRRPSSSSSGPGLPMMRQGCTPLADTSAAISAPVSGTTRAAGAGMVVVAVGHHAAVRRARS